MLGEKKTFFIWYQRSYQEEPESPIFLFLHMFSDFTYLMKLIVMICCADLRSLLFLENDKFVLDSNSKCDLLFVEQQLKSLPVFQLLDAGCSGLP